MKKILIQIMSGEINEDGEALISLPISTFQTFDEFTVEIHMDSIIEFNQKYLKDMGRRGVVILNTIKSCTSFKTLENLKKFSKKNKKDEQVKSIVKDLVSYDVDTQIVVAILKEDDGGTIPGFILTMRNGQIK